MSVVYKAAGVDHIQFSIVYAKQYDRLDDLQLYSVFESRFLIDNALRILTGTEHPYSAKEYFGIILYYNSFEFQKQLMALGVHGLKQLDRVYTTPEPGSEPVPTPLHHGVD